jgi:hypothetical protein
MALQVVQRQIWFESSESLRSQPIDEHDTLARLQENIALASEDRLLAPAEN